MSPVLRALALLITALVLCSPVVRGALTPGQTKENLDSFDYVWNTVRAKTWDPSLGGVNWEAVRAELRPRVEKAKTEEQARAAIGEMLARLRLSHFAVIPGSVYHDLETARAPTGEAPSENLPGEGSTGIDVRVLSDAAVVVRVDPKSSAEAHGVRPGWAVQRIAGEEVGPLLTRVGDTYSGSTLREMMLARAILARLDGPEGNAVEVEFLDGRERTVTVTLDRTAPRGTPSKFGYLPESFVWFESRRAAPDVGYVAFNYFLDPARLVPDFHTSLESCSDCAGFVIDLRGNPGGIGVLAMGLAGFFLDRPDLKLGTMYMRDLPLNFVINPRPPVFEKPLAVLVDGLSASTSEIFAGGLQDLKRARIFGSRTAGAALPSMIERLPNGDGFQYAAATYKSESGKTLEGNGVTPDAAVSLTRTALLSGHDPVIDAAVQWIHEQSSKGTKTP